MQVVSGASSGSSTVTGTTKLRKSAAATQSTSNHLAPARAVASVFYAGVNAALYHTQRTHSKFVRGLQFLCIIKPRGVRDEGGDTQQLFYWSESL